ncbi:alpha/beta hydrolase [Amycolatopsis cynarae]|uniref:Alpha/beta hydrolase n=1 Tax=Amycolatopsis cynarae TaxID=2995223 RepID=A0ABY7BA67_9PSEU|nr:alpha/beta hydrolase [Amycolatopsis sp. HUAS 11-8]WAL67756.1 alpha/beta hydrolase [Amycolatopsis sp. HUAS 11-8]
MNLTEKTYQVGNREIFLAETGDGPAVLLLHGGGPGASGVSNYVRNIEPLAEHYRVIVPDLPGYGRSTKGIDLSDPFGDLAAALRGLLDELGLRSAHVIGNSYGASAALRLALDHPGRVDRQVLMGPGGIGTTRALPTPGLQKLLNYYRGDGPSRRKLEEFIRDHLVFDGSAVPAETIEARYQASIDPEVVADPPLRRPSSLKALWRMDFTRDRRLSRLRTRTLVIWGAQDKVNRPGGGHTLARTMPNCDLLLVANTGHWVQWERAELFNAAVRTFFEETA